MSESPPTAATGQITPPATNGGEPPGAWVPSRPPPPAPAAELKALELARAKGVVTFHDVARAWFYLCSDTNADQDGAGALDAEQRAAFESLFPELLRIFGDTRGGLISSYFCEHIQVAAAMTDIATAAEQDEHVVGAPSEDAARSTRENPPRRGPWGRLREAVGESRRRRRRQQSEASSSAIHIEPTFGDPEDWKAKEILFGCLDLHYRAIEFLKPKPRKICMRKIFGIITALLGTLDNRAAQERREAAMRGEPPLAGAPVKDFRSDVQGVECLENELGEATRYYQASAQRQAQNEYLLGMALLGLPLLAVIGAVVWLALDDVRGVPLDALLISLGAGGLGAVVSVMTRMTSGRLVLDYEQGKAGIRVLGMIRPLIGAVFGLVLFVLLTSELMDFTQRPSPRSELYYFAAIAFVAGFSERFAQDAVARVGGRAAGGRQPAAATTGAGGVEASRLPPTAS